MQLQSFPPFRSLVASHCIHLFDGQALKVFLKFGETFFLVLKDLRKYYFFRESSKNLAQRYFWDVTYYVVRTEDATDGRPLTVTCHLCDRCLVLCQGESGDGNDTQPLLEDLLSALDTMVWQTGLWSAGQKQSSILPRFGPNEAVCSLPGYTLVDWTRVVKWTIAKSLS